MIDTKEKSYCIIKEMVIDNRTLNDILLNDESTILEFVNQDEAERVANIFELYSDKGWKYVVKEIG